MHIRPSGKPDENGTCVGVVSHNPLKPFGRVWGASGIEGFFGEGYSHHRFTKMLPGAIFDGMTFVAKTTTLESRAGNMPLDDNWQPRDFKPECIAVTIRSWFRGAALNAVGLSGPGARPLFAANRWQERTEPFMLSFMSVEKTAEDRLRELREFLKILALELPAFSTYVGLQINMSCPNTGHDVSKLAAEADSMLLETDVVDIPIIIKINSDTPVEVGLQLARNRRCDGICVSNTLPWGSLPESVREESFGAQESPLEKFGGGGFSGGDYLREKTIRWIQEFRKDNRYCDINACGGIRKSAHVKEYYRAGASSVSLGSISFLRPWRVQGCIKEANKVRPT